MYKNSSWSIFESNKFIWSIFETHIFCWSILDWKDRKHVFYARVDRRVGLISIAQNVPNLLEFRKGIVFF